MAPPYWLSWQSSCTQLKIERTSPQWVILTPKGGRGDFEQFIPEMEFLPSLFAKWYRDIFDSKNLTEFQI